VQSGELILRKKGIFARKFGSLAFWPFFVKKKKGLLRSSVFLKRNLFIFISKSGDPFPGRFSQIYLAINQK
jgi:hypothetical protein